MPVQSVALFLDIDGTLIDIATEPAAAFAPPGLIDLLRRLSARLDGALAILSGRSIAMIDHLLAPLTPRAAGGHGSEIRAAADGPVARLAPMLAESFVAKAVGLAELDPGILVETKGAALAVHYRLAPEWASELERLLRDLLLLYGDGWELLPGRQLIEVVPKGVSKGAALRRFMHQRPFAGRRPIMIGDDVGDLSAFAAAECLGGQGLSVGGEFFHPDQAVFRGTAAVRQWLSDFGLGDLGLSDLAERTAEARPGQNAPLERKTWSARPGSPSRSSALTPGKAARSRSRAPAEARNGKRLPGVYSANIHKSSGSAAP